MSTIEFLLAFGIVSNIIGWAINFVQIQKLHALHDRQAEISEIYLEWKREELGKDIIL